MEQDAKMYDIVIVGAGVHGLIMAKTYLQVHPDSSLVILDSSISIGGVWAKERLYPGLKTNNMIGTYEFSDFPMIPCDWGLNSGFFVPGLVVHDYLNAFAKRFDISKRCQLGTKVMSADVKNDSTWELIVERGDHMDTITTHKLVVATGITSDLKMPQLEGMDSFSGPMLHSHDLGIRSTELETASDVVILGGSKSAFDTVYLCCTNTSARCHWIIRETGHGTNWISPPYVTPFKCWLEKLLTTRFLTWFSPFGWGWADGYEWPSWFLQQTWLGQRSCRGFWWVINDDVTKLTGYDNHPETRKLKPKNEVYWTAAALSILNYDVDIFEFIRSGRVQVSVADIEKIVHGSVELNNGMTDASDAIGILQSHLYQRILESEMQCLHLWLRKRRRAFASNCQYSRNALNMAWLSGKARPAMISASIVLCFHQIYGFYRLETLLLLDNI